MEKESYDDMTKGFIWKKEANTSHQKKMMKKKQYMQKKNLPE